MCILPGKFFREHNSYVGQKGNILCNLCETNLAWSQGSSSVRYIFDGYTNVTIIKRLYVSDYYQYSIIIFCPIAHH